MRISTSTLFNANVAQLNTLESNMLQTQQQVATGRSILTPADNPVAAAQALQMTQTDATNTQYLSNIGMAQDSQTLTSGVLQNFNTLLQSIQTSIVGAGDPAMSDANRQSLAATLQGNLNQLTAMANSQDSAGNYMFSGFKGSTQPFVNTPAGVQYMGDNGQRMIQVSANSQAAASNSGAAIFMNIKNGNGTFVTQTAPANTGTGVISLGSLAVPPPTAAQLGNTYTISFTSPTTYTVTGTDSTGAALPTVAQPGALPTAQPYTSGQAISFNGIQFNISGAPASGDTFTVAPSTNQSVFQTISNFIATLNTPVAGNPAATAQLTAGIQSALNGINNAMASVSTANASVGSNLDGLTALTTAETNQGIQYKAALSNLQDVNMTQAITNLTQEQTILTAAQKSFVSVENLSVFNYIQ
jgi:flagellar hook-associated protein 3 FlgL